MLNFFSHWTEHFQQAWHLSYFLSFLVVVGVVFLLRRHSPGSVRFTALMLVIFVLLLAAEALFATLDAPAAKTVMHYSALLVLGGLLIRQVGVFFFRWVIPRFQLQPPRILEELLILMFYAGWTLYLLSGAGLELSSLVTSTAVVTAVLAFAMQDTLGNILSGLALQLDKSICIGDWLEFEDLSGEVIQVQWRHTAIMTRFGEKILIPNSDLMKNRVKIIGGQTLPGRYNTLYFYGSYAVAPNVVVETVEKNLRRMQFRGQSAQTPPICQVFDFADGHITYALHYWLAAPGAAGATKSALYQHIYALFQRQGWYLSAPNRDISHMSHKHKTQWHQQSLRHSTSIKLVFLAQIPLFAALTEEEKEQAAERLKTAFFVQGSTLIVQGAAGESMFFIVQGEAEVWVASHGRKQQVAVLKAGDIFGEMSLMTGDPRRATVIARSDLVCYELDKDGFAAIIQERPELAENIASLLSTRAQELDSVQQCLSHTQLEEQKQHLLHHIRRWFRLP